MPVIDAGGVRLNYRFDGPDGAPLLLLSNSLGTDLAMWDAQVPAFSRHVRVLRYDSRGHGRSDVPAGPTTIADLGRDVLALLDGLGLACVRFCGLSMGGMVGMWLAVNAAPRIERLVLCNTSARIGNAEIWNQRIARVAVDGMAAIVPGVVERWFTAGFRARAPEAVERVRRMLLATPAAGYTACCAAVRDHDLIDRLDAIAAPTLVIAGAHDGATPPDHARLIAGRVPGARMVELDAAHLSNIEAEDAFTATVADFACR